VVNDVTGAAWTKEGDALPDIAVDSAALIAVAYQLGGIPMITNRAVRDSAVNLLADLRRILRDYLGTVLDDGLLHGSGTEPGLPSVVALATAWTGADLWDATGAAVGEFAAAGGVAITITLCPADAVAEAFRCDEENRPLYPYGLTRLAGLDVVTVPALTAGETLVYDRAGYFLVVGDNFGITPSPEYALATGATPSRSERSASSPSRSRCQLERPAS
jgi:hypothetical protein